MLHVGSSFALYTLLLDPGCCPRAHFEFDGQVESDPKIKNIADADDHKITPYITPLKILKTPPPNECRSLAAVQQETH